MSGIALNCKSSSMNSSQVGHLIPYRLCLLSCQCYLHPVQPSDYWACGRCLAKLLDLWLSLAWRSFSFLLAGLQDITYHAITSNRCRPAPRTFHDTTTKKHHRCGRPTRFAKCGIPWRALPPNSHCRTGTLALGGELGPLVLPPTKPTLGGRNATFHCILPPLLLCSDWWDPTDANRLILNQMSVFGWWYYFSFFLVLKLFFLNNTTKLTKKNSTWSLMRAIR